MLDTIDKALKTPFGLKLMSPANLEIVSKSTALGEYFSGDRENSEVFKHACMLARAAMFKVAKEVKDISLAKRISSLAYWLIDIILPFRIMKNTYEVCGNPRFCTQ